MREEVAVVRRERGSNGVDSYHVFADGGTEI